MTCLSCSGACKKCLLGGLLILVAFVGVYFMYFHHAPPEDIMAANRKSSQSLRKTLHNVDDDYEEDYEDNNDHPVVSSRKKWERYITENNYVSIGELYDKCDGPERLMVGKTIMIPDPRHGGIQSRTFVNTTWDHDVDDGEVSIEVKYNGKDLYSNKWELCTIDEDTPDRIIFCTIKAGKKNYIKDIKIPNYIPKGRYVTKVVATDQEGDIIGCAFSDFVL